MKLYINRKGEGQSYPVLQKPTGELFPGTGAAAASSPVELDPEEALEVFASCVRAGWEWESVP